MAPKTFDEWVHDMMEKDHEPTTNGGWLRRAYEAGYDAAVDKAKLPHICCQCSRSCKGGNHLTCFEFVR